MISQTLLKAKASRAKSNRDRLVVSVLVSYRPSSSTLSLPLQYGRHSNFGSLKISYTRTKNKNGYVLCTSSILSDSQTIRKQVRHVNFKSLPLSTYFMRLARLEHYGWCIVVYCREAHFSSISDSAKVILSVAADILQITAIIPFPNLDRLLNRSRNLRQDRMRFSLCLQRTLM